MRATFLLCAVVVSFGATTASAQAGSATPDPPNVVEAREHIQRGTELLEDENYDAALSEFERAYQLVGEHPARYLILFNIARAHEHRFRYDLALRYYHRYLDEGAEHAERRDDVEAAIHRLEGL